jgi:hypothetical protein
LGTSPPDRGFIATHLPARAWTWGGAQKLHQASSSRLSCPLLEEISRGFDHSHLLRDRRGNLLIYDDGILFR